MCASQTDWNTTQVQCFWTIFGCFIRHLGVNLIWFAFCWRVVRIWCRNLSFLKKTRGVGWKAQNFARCSLVSTWVSIYSGTWELGTPKGLWKTVLNSEVVLFLRSISLYWIGLGTEVTVLNSQVVPISRVVLKTGFTVYEFDLICFLLKGGARLLGHALLLGHIRYMPSNCYRYLLVCLFFSVLLDKFIFGWKYLLNHHDLASMLSVQVSILKLCNIS